MRRLLQASTLTLDLAILSSSLVELLMAQLSYERWREQCERRIRPRYKKVVHGLHAQSIYKALASDLVIRLEDVVKILNGVLVVTHVVMVEEIASADHLPMLTVVDCLRLDATVQSLLATGELVSRLDG